MALSDEELENQRRITKELERQAKLRQDISSSLAKYNEAITDLRHKQKVINDLEKQQKKLAEEMSRLSGQDLKEAEIKLSILEEQTAEIRKQGKLIQDAVESIDAKKIARDELFSKGAMSLGKAIGSLDKTIISGYNKLKSLGLFDMDKAIKKSALEMGVLSKEAIGYRTTIKEVAKRTNMIGIGVKELSELQSNYTEELGRNVMMSEQGMEAMAQIAASTGLGAQGTAKMASDMENVGLSTERVGEFVGKALNKSHKLGLNATKTMKNLTGGMKLLNKYNFKDGLAGLQKMAETVTKLGVGMDFAAGFADKLWNVEGAVDMSAQLQVMGGEFAKMADPFHLMYMARNDLNGLTEELANAAAASAKFNDKTKEFDISAMEMHRLKVIAEQTGISYDELATAGKNAAKFTRIKSQLSFSIEGGEDGKAMQDFITNKSTFNKDGKATIKIGSDTKLLSQLSATDKQSIKTMMKQEESMKQRAEESKTFDETLNNFVNGLKVSLLPFIEAMEPMIGGLQKLSERFVAGEWPKKIEKLAGQVGDLVTTIGSWIIDNPIEAAMAYAATKITGFLFEKATWIANGLALSQGFNMGNTGASSAWQPGQVGPQAGGMSRMKGVGMGAVASLAGAGIGMANEAGVFGEKGSTGHKMAGIGAGALEWGGTGAMIGSLIAPGIGTAIGAAIGGLAGGIKGAYDEGMFGEQSHDAVFDSYKQGYKKNTKGSGFAKKRSIVEGGKIHPIDDMDKLVAMKKGGTINNAMNQSVGNQSMRVDFGEITINGKLEVTSPGSPGLSMDLMKDPQFKRDITRVVSAEIEKNRNGGKNSG